MNQYEIAIFSVSDTDADDMEMIEGGLNTYDNAKAAASYAFEDGDIANGRHAEAWYIENGSPVGTVAIGTWQESDFS